MGKRRYTDEERANALAALAANGGDVNRTARQLGIPEVTLRQWKSGARHPEAIQMSESKKPLLADALEETARAILPAILKKIPDAELRDLSVSLGIVVDKMQVLRGEPSSITGSLSDAERVARLRALVEQFRGGAGGNGHPPYGASAVVGALPRPADVGVPEHG